MTPEKRAKARERAIWRRLLKLQEGGAALSKSATERLAALDAKYERQPVEDNLDELHAYSVEFDEKEGLRALVDMPLGKLADLVCRRVAWTPLDGWGDFVRLKPARALIALRRGVRRGCWPRELWRYFLNWLDFGSGEERPRRCFLMLTYSTLNEASQDVVRDLTPNLSSLLKVIASDLPENWEGAFYQAWDRLWQSARLQPETIVSEVDSLTQALNHPAGALAEGLIRRVRATKPKSNSGLPEQTRERAEKILDSDPSEGGRYGQIMLAAYLPYLFFVDKVWVKQNLIPRFAWEQALGADFWTAFLYRPRLSPDLLDLLRDHLVATIEHREQLPDNAQEAVVRLFGTLGIEEPAWIPDQQERQLARRLKSSELVKLAWHLRNVVSREPESAAERWRGAVGPWFDRVWPKDKAMRSEDEAEALAEVVIETAEALPAALQVVSPFLSPVADFRIPYLLTKDDGPYKELVQRFPKEILELLNKIVPAQKSDTQHWSYHKLSEVLDQLEAENPELGNDQNFKRLREFLLM